jgi:hypothetical protein
MKILAIIPILFLLSCNDNPTDTSNSTPFSLEVQVIDKDGIPKEGINVSIWNNISYSGTWKKALSENNILASTSIGFFIPEQCFIEIASFDIEGKLKENILSGEYLPGSYRIIYSGSEPVGTAVYKCKMTVYSDSLYSNIISGDSIYMVLHQPDPSVSVVGKSNFNGKVKTYNKLLFPQLYNLPVIRRTGPDSPEELGNIIFSDSVTIILADDSFSKTIVYKKRVSNGDNKITLIWDESLTKTIKQIKPIEQDYSYRDESVSPGINIYRLKETDVEYGFFPGEWILEQNYPNPYN